MTQRRRVFALALAANGAIGCTSFATVRSAEVSPGAAFTVQASVASPPGDEAAWFWAYDCADNCNHLIVGGDLVYAYGLATKSRLPFAVGLGVNGLLPYVEGYAQLNASRTRPFGVGVRAGIPVWSWSEHQIYGRLDVPLGAESRFLWNPAVLYHGGKAPNGNSPGSFVGIVQGFGIQFGTGSRVVTPSVALVWGRAQHRTGFFQSGPASRVFATAGISVGLRHTD